MKLSTTGATRHMIEHMDHVPTDQMLHLSYVRSSIVEVDPIRAPQLFVIDYVTPSLPTTATTGCKRKSASTASSLAAMPDCRRKVCKRATGWITSASLQIPAVVNYTFGLMCAYLLLLPPNYPFPCPNGRLLHQQQQTQQDELSMPNWCNIDGFSQIHEYLEGEATAMGLQTSVLFDFARHCRCVGSNYAKLNIFSFICFDNQP